LASEHHTTIAKGTRLQNTVFAAHER
jgi:hypothetical protein